MVFFYKMVIFHLSLFLLLRKLDISDPVDGAAAVEMLLQLLGRRAIVHVPDVNGLGDVNGLVVDLHLLLEGEVKVSCGRERYGDMFVDFHLHLSQLLRLFLHGLHTSLDALLLGILYLDGFIPLPAKPQVSLEMMGLNVVEVTGKLVDPARQHRKNTHILLYIPGA